MQTIRLMAVRTSRRRADPNVRALWAVGTAAIAATRKADLQALMTDWLHTDAAHPGLTASGNHPTAFDTYNHRLWRRVGDAERTAAFALARHTAVADHRLPRENATVAHIGGADHAKETTPVRAPT